MPIYVHTIEEARKVIYDALIQGPVFDHSHPPTQVDVDRQMDAQDYGLECVLIAHHALLLKLSSRLYKNLLVEPAYHQMPYSIEC